MNGPDEMMQKDAFVDELLSYLQASPTPFHAVKQLSQRLDAGGFSYVDESLRWQLRPGGKYYTTRNGSSLIAFVMGTVDPTGVGLRLFGAHTDSPCLKIKPTPELVRHGCQQLAVAPYGGVLLNPWFDRDLSIAGRVVYQTDEGKLASLLLDFERAVASVPSLAIHLDKEANSQRSINAQLHLPLVLGLGREARSLDFKALLAQEIHARFPDVRLQAVLDYEMNCYDTQAPARTGLAREFIASARLDNLLSCYVGLQALLEAPTTVTSLLVCNDHEEVGSRSAEGADGPMLQSVLRRLLGDEESQVRALSRSLLISADNAHAIHPNYADKHDGNHGPQINQGPVIKINGNQRYASNSESSAIFRRLCEVEQVPVQTFVVRSDMACGSTIGPITAAKLGIRTIDVGAPQWAMHSIRETAGVDDAHGLYRVARRFFGLQQLEGPF
jgi:aspartyl aminopeptidase